MSTASRYLHGEKFVRALVDSGLLPRGTTAVTITAEIGGVCTIEYEALATEDLLAVVPGLEADDDPEKR